MTTHTTFIANTTRIAAAFLNAIQAPIVALYNGTKTVKKLQVDGTGNAATSVSSGGISASGSIGADGAIVAGTGIVSTLGDITAVDATTTVSAAETRSSATPGSGQSVALGTLYRDTVPIAWAQCSSGGGLTRGANIASVTKNSTGNYTVALQVGVTGSGHLCAVVTLIGAAGQFLAVDGTSSIGVQTYAVDGVTATDKAFNVVIFGGG